VLVNNQHEGDVPLTVQGLVGYTRNQLRCDDLNAAIWRNASENGLFLSKTLPRRSKAQSGAWRNGTWLGLTDLEALLTVAREAHSAQQVTDRRRSIRFRWECRFDFDHVMRLDYLMAVGRVLQLRVES
jgi:hypothetical protein